MEINNMPEITTAQNNDKQDIIDFINYVFSVAYTAHDFKKKLPKVYGDNAKDAAANHYIIKKDGRIKAALSNRTISVDICGDILKYGLIGNVSVHPYCRGEGYMTELMNHAIEKASKDGIDLIVLTGQRQRPAGTSIKYTITDINIRHALKNTDCRNISFLPLENASDNEIDEIIKLYQNRPAHAIREKDEYINIMSSWEEKTNLIFTDGELVGYIYGALDEIVLKNEELLYPIIKAYFNISNQNKVDISVHPFEKRRAELLAEICETSYVTPIALVKVLNWENVLKAFLKLKAKISPLDDTQEIIKIENDILKISINSGIITVEKSKKEIPRLHLKEKEAMNLFFGLNGLIIPQAEATSLSALPFVIDKPDKF